MTKTQIDAIVNMLGYPVNAWVNPEPLYRITVVKWENVYIGKDMTRVMFDDTNELLHVSGVTKISSEKYNSLKNKPNILENIESNGKVIGYYVQDVDENGNIMEDLYPYQNVKMFAWKRYM